MSFEPMPGLQPSILDRLLDSESAGTVASPGYTVRQMEVAVLRDLNDLLNSVCPHRQFPDQYPETRDSIVTYGMPDLVSAEVASPKQRAEIGKLIRATVMRFEPRLRSVRVTLLTPEPDARMAIRFRIDGRLAVDPAPDVAFDTILDLSTGKCEVKPQVSG
jgi:type VI secretion system protein ImpF